MRRPRAERQKSDDCSSSTAPMSTRAMEARMPLLCMLPWLVAIASWWTFS